MREPAPGRRTPEVGPAHGALGKEDPGGGALGVSYGPAPGALHGAYAATEENMGKPDRVKRAYK